MAMILSNIMNLGQGHSNTKPGVTFVKISALLY